MMYLEKDYLQQKITRVTLIKKCLNLLLTMNFLQNPNALILPDIYEGSFI